MESDAQEDAARAERHPRTGPVRWFLLAVGLACAGLGLVGAFLPVLPTTPFLILATACFARSSRSLHERLLANRVFGPYITQWERDHTIPREAKRKAHGLVVISFAVSIYLANGLALRATLGGIAIALILFLHWLPTSPPAPPAPPDGPDPDGT